MPIHQFLIMNSHSLTNFAVNRNHVCTVMSEVENLSSLARDFCSTAQHFVHTSESSIQRSEQSVFVVSLELPSYTIRNPRTTGSPMESSSPPTSGPKFNGNVFTAAPVSRFIFTHSNRFGLLLALTSKPHCENELAEVSYVCSQPSCRHHAIHQNSSHRSIRHSSNHRSRKCQWDISVQIPECPSLSLISSFQDLERPVFDVLPLCLFSFVFSFGFSFVFFTLAFALTLGQCLALFAFARRLLACALACMQSR